MDQQSDVLEIAAQVQKNHQELLHIDGGFSIEYEIEVTQDRADGMYVYPKGVVGVLRVRWPELYVRVEGDIRSKTKGEPVILEGHLREGNYNFVTHTSLAREANLLAQACDFRHVITAKLAYPLVLRHFAEANQTFVLGKDDATNGSLQLAGYRVAGHEEVDGYPCVVVERPGADKLWICLEKSCVVVRRELFDNSGKLMQVTINQDLRELTDRAWIPYHQIKESYGGSQGSLNYVLNLKVTRSQVGNVEDRELTVNIPDDVHAIDDFIQGVSLIARGGPDGVDSEIVISNARRMIALRRAGQQALTNRRITIAVNTALFLGLVIVVVIRRKG